MTHESESNPFVTHLEALAEDRPALAALRRGLGQPPATTPEMHRYVLPWLPRGLYPRQEEAYYLVAALFGAHPQGTRTGNMGDHFARASRQSGNETAVERRFTNLLAAHPDDLPFHLRQAITFLRAQEVAVNWHQLLPDVQAWSHPAGYVQRNWAHGFWGRRAEEEESAEVAAGVTATKSVQS